MESNGAFIRYPEEPRSNNYDSRVRSWYKNAKNKNGDVNLSDAYVASAGYRAIVSSATFNNAKGDLRGVISVDINVDYLSQILDVIKDKGSSESFILLDRNGTILVDQISKEDEFKNITESSIELFGDDFEFGKEVIKRYTDKNKTYELRSFTSKNDYIPLEYVFICPAAEVDYTNSQILRMIIILSSISLIILVLDAIFVGSLICKQVNTTVNALKNVSEGDGDLTVRLPLTGTKETVLLSQYFNETFEKIHKTVSTMNQVSKTMSYVATELSSNSVETTSAIHEIDTSLASIKSQMINQTSVGDASTQTINYISTSIDELNNNIVEQSNSVSSSSSAIEQMVSNIRSVSKILEKNDVSVSELSSSAETGRTIVDKTVELIHKINEDSEGLLEASTIIQSIAE